MGNYDDYDPTVHRSRVAKKQQEEFLKSEKPTEQKTTVQKTVSQKTAADKPATKSSSLYASNKPIADKTASQTKKQKQSVASNVADKVLGLVTVKPDKKKEPKESKPKTKKKKTKKSIIWTIIKICICFALVCCIAVGTYVGVVISKAPKIDTSDLDSLLTQSSVLYDDQGNVMDTAFADENRTSVELNQVPMHVRYAFIDLEDKTFEKHHGFNIIRIFGAIKDAIFNGGHISGTSTITQQLARNLFLTDIMSDRSISRKITEAYYAVILENHLSKDEILEAYLNTINFGLGYGVQTASQTYFSKDISEVTIAEAAALACLPQAPSTYALVQRINLEYVTEDMENLIKKDSEYGYIWNDTGKDRIKLCLGLMKQQGHISQEEYDEAIQVQVKDMVNPNFSTIESNSNYFADYVITTVINDLQEQYGYSYDTAHDLVYNGGLKIYTTMNAGAQEICEKEFENDSNFPVPTSYKLDKDGNMLTPTQYIYEDGEKKELEPVVMLYNIKNYIGTDTTLRIKPSEFEKQSDGSIKLLFGKRLAFYKTTVQGQTDISIEFRPMFSKEDGKLYSIPGGYVNIPQKYKTMDSNYDVTISADFFKDYPNFFSYDAKGNLCTQSFTLRAKVIQPQAAMTIIDNKTGSVKAMVGGRKTSGRMLYNRATTTRQPGSSIKPLAVYGAALQQSYELSQSDKTFNYWSTGFDKQGTKLWGDYITAASIVDDEPTFIEERLWPVNSYKYYQGLYTLREALQQSVNVCAVKILSQVGVDYAYDMVKKYGITTLAGEDDKNLSSLGVGGMVNGTSTLEMASAYTTFVNEGIHKSYYCYEKVTTRAGATLLEATQTETKVLDPGVAWIVRDLLQTVVSEGIGSNAKISGEKVGGKTGTTTDSFDIWFDGFTANYTASLWIGNDTNISLSSMSTAAAKLWSKIMKQIPEAKGGTYSAAPSNVVTATIDTKTGLLATENSSKTRTEYFTEGTQPTETGDHLKTVQVCSESGMLATPYCPHTTYKTAIDRGYPADPSVKDYKDSIPYYYCPDHNPNHDVYPVEPYVEYDDDGRLVSKEEAPEVQSPEDTQSGQPYNPYINPGYTYYEPGLIVDDGEESPD